MLVKILMLVILAQHQACRVYLQQTIAEHNRKSRQFFAELDKITDVDEIFERMTRKIKQDQIDFDEIMRISDRLSPKK